MFGTRRCQRFGPDSSLYGHHLQTGVRRGISFSDTKHGLWKIGRLDRSRKPCHSEARSVVGIRSSKGITDCHVGPCPPRNDRRRSGRHIATRLIAWRQWDFSNPADAQWASLHASAILLVGTAIGRPHKKPVIPRERSDRGNPFLKGYYGLPRRALPSSQ